MTNIGSGVEDQVLLGHGRFWKTPFVGTYNAITGLFTKYVGRNDSTRKIWRVVRFEDLKLYPRETLKKLLEFLHLPWSDTLLSCTINGEENEEFMGTHGFDPAPIYKRHEKYFGGLDRYRAELVHQSDYEVWGYKLKYYDGMEYTPSEIRALFRLPYATEKADWGSKREKAHLRRLLLEKVEEILSKGREIPKDENGEEMVPVEWLKPDIPEGAKLYE